jgi:hypothetical protein
MYRAPSKIFDRSNYPGFVIKKRVVKTYSFDVEPALQSFMYQESAASKNTFFQRRRQNFPEA